MDGISSVFRPTNYKTTCANCGTAATEEAPLKACQKCRTSRYCDRPCQVADWKKHKSVCATYQMQGVMASKSTNMGEKPPKGRAAAAMRSRQQIVSDLNQWAVALNGEAVSASGWWAMDLVHDQSKAKTHFFALTLRRDPDKTDPRKFYSLVDAEVLPLSLLEEKFRFAADAATDQPANYLDSIRRECDAMTRGGRTLGAMIALYLELNPGEEKSVEQAVKDKMTFQFQPHGLWKTQRDKFASPPFRREQMARFWKTCLSNALDGGAWAIKYTPLY